MNLNNQAIIDGIVRHDSGIIKAIVSKYFPYVRKKLGNKGYNSDQVKNVFARTMAGVILEIRQNKMSVHVPFESYFENHLQANLKNKTKSETDHGAELVASCLTIMDEQNKKILQLHYGVGMNFEQIAQQMEFSNAVIAQHQTDKAFQQLENIAKARLQ